MSKVKKNEMHGDNSTTDKWIYVAVQCIWTNLPVNPTSFISPKIVFQSKLMWVTAHTHQNRWEIIASNQGQYLLLAYFSSSWIFSLRFMIIHLRKTYTIFMQSLRYHFFKWRIIGQGLGFTESKSTLVTDLLWDHMQTSIVSAASLGVHCTQTAWHSDCMVLTYIRSWWEGTASMLVNSASIAHCCTRTARFTISHNLICISYVHIIS